MIFCMNRYTLFLQHIHYVSPIHYICFKYNPTLSPTKREIAREYNIKKFIYIQKCYDSVDRDLKSTQKIEAKNRIKLNGLVAYATIYLQAFSLDANKVKQSSVGKQGT